VYSRVIVELPVMNAKDTWKEILFAWAYQEGDDEWLGARVRMLIDDFQEEKKKNIAAGIQKVKDRQECKPVVIDGVRYSSTNEAMRETGRSYGYVKKRRV
jgi:hypothetical protein